ncbi:MAG TPA: secretin N-terminal domain-containing protein [Verrucomicrobiae bacterium]|nr:secretin N-terminal domain-containing protein [Verrucomicrobiae bacterium]
MKTNSGLILAAALTWITMYAPAQQADPTTKPEPAKPEPAAETPPVRPVGENERGIRLNFRGVSLDMVLNYLSEAAGFVIVLETKVEGTVDAWSNQPLTKNEAVELLNTVLAKNGYAAIRNGRTLKIVARDAAKTKDIPVRAGNKPEELPKSDEMITQIIPVKYANAPAMVQNLTPLLETSYTTLTANESGNALVLTGTQSDVRRMMEIVTALDTSISSVSTIRVFALRFADAKALSDTIKELFQPPTQGNNNDRRNQFLNRFGGGGGPGGFGGGQGGRGNRGGGGATSPAATANSRVVAVADERSNSLVVSAPDEFIPEIETLVREIDVSISDVTELRVFPLSNADPQEMADIMGQLFPDETGTTGNNPGDFRFGGFPGGGINFGNNNNNRRRGNNNTANANQSDRMKKKGRVVAVPDLRTSSLIVSADMELMPQIEAMIQRLDANQARKQKVYVYSIENADVQQVEQIVRDMFDRSGTGNRNNNLQNNPFQNRSQQSQQQQNQNNGLGGFGNGQNQNRTVGGGQ